MILYPARCGQLASARFTPFGEPLIRLGTTLEALEYDIKCDFYNGAYSFASSLDSIRPKEGFEWQACSLWESISMGHCSGMKLIRIKTGDVIALYGKVTCSTWKKTGKVRFLDGQDFGDEFQDMAVMSLLAILEAKRRYMERTVVHSPSSKGAMMATIVAACC
jgi:hypothetical protein